MSGLGSQMADAAWRWRPMLTVMGGLAGRALGAGTVRLTGMTSNGPLFDANPQVICLVSAGAAVVEGEALGPVGALADQAHLGDFCMPQRGIFAVGRVFVTPVDTVTA